MTLPIALTGTEYSVIPRKLIIDVEVGSERFSAVADPVTAGVQDIHVVVMQNRLPLSERYSEYLSCVRLLLDQS